MNKADFYYKQHLFDIVTKGYKDLNPRAHYKDGMPAHSKYITQIFEKYDIDAGQFPIPTLRNTAIKTGFKEMLWIYQLQSNKLSDAHDLGIGWWDDWNIGDGTIGHRYGYTVKKYGLMDELLHNLQNKTFSRRHIIDLFQYDDLKSSDGLDPCAFMTIWTPVIKDDGNIYLDLTLIQRSNDYLVAGYINKIQYVSLLLMVCGHLGWKAGTFSHLVQNLHIYDRHFEAAEEVLRKEPLDNIKPSISLPVKSFYDYKVGDLSVSGTKHITKIKSPLELAI